MADEPTIRESLGLALGARTRVMLGGAAVVIGIFLLTPILIILPMSLTRDVVFTWPPDLASFRWYQAFFESSVWVDALSNSIQIAVPVALMSTIMGTLAALGMANVKRGRHLLKMLFISPLVLPLITYALGLYDVSVRLDLIGSTWPVIIGQTMLAAPLVFIIVSAGLASRDPQLPRAAASLGAPARVILWQIELRLIRASVVAAGLVALVYSFDEIIVAYFLLPPGRGTLPVQMLSSTREAQEPIIAAAAMLVIAVVATAGVLILLVRALASRRP